MSISRKFGNIPPKCCNSKTRLWRIPLDHYVVTMTFDKDLLNYEYPRFCYICVCVLDEFYYGTEYSEYSSYRSCPFRSRMKYIGLGDHKATF